MRLLRRALSSRSTVCAAGLLTLIGLLTYPALAPTQQQGLKVFERFTKDALDAYLKSRNIPFTSTAGREFDSFSLPFSLGNKKVSLELRSSGLLLYAFVEFPGKAPEAVNAWNRDRVNSRAVALEERTRLEWDLDSRLGITEKSLDFFLDQFKTSIRDFDLFLQKYQPVANPNLTKEPGNVVPTGANLSQHLVLANNDRVVEVRFPVGDPNWETAWKITWTLESYNDLIKTSKIQLGQNKSRENKFIFFKIKSAHLKPGREAPWIQVLDDTHVSELYVPYHDGKTQWYDIRDQGWLEVLLDKEKGPNGRLLGSERIVMAEVRDRGLAFKHKNQSRRGQELVLWTNFYAYNYTYLLEMAFADDGVITFRHAPTAMNYVDRSSDKENVVFPHLSHMHNSLWRIGVKLGPDGENHNNEALIFRHKELDQMQKIDWHVPSSTGRQKQDISAMDLFEAVSQETRLKWDPEQFTRIRVVNPDYYVAKGFVKNREPIAYDLYAMPLGTARHKKTAQPAVDYAVRMRAQAARFAQFDFWITHADSPVHQYIYLPDYFDKNGNGLRPLRNCNVVLWHQSSVLHTPRAEDGIPQVANGEVSGQALATWSIFQLRPRNLFAGTPIYPYRNLPQPSRN